MRRPSKVQIACIIRQCLDEKVLKIESKLAFRVLYIYKSNIQFVLKGVIPLWFLFGYTIGLNHP